MKFWLQLQMIKDSFKVLVEWNVLIIRVSLAKMRLMFIPHDNEIQRDVD